jgi:hypothetical protein
MTSVSADDYPPGPPAFGFMPTVRVEIAVQRSEARSVHVESRMGPCASDGSTGECVHGTSGRGAVVNVPEACAVLEREGIRATPAGLTQPESGRLFAERFPEIESLAPSERPAFMFPRLFGAVRAGPMLADLMPIASHYAPDVVVHEAGELAAPIVAASLGVPNITHGFGGTGTQGAHRGGERRGCSSLAVEGSRGPPVRRLLRAPVPRHLPTKRAHTTAADRSAWLAPARQKRTYVRPLRC